MCVPRVGEGKPPRDERLDLLLLEQVQQGDQILLKPFRFEAFERLDALGDHAFAAREKPRADDVAPEGDGPTKVLTTPRTA